MRHTTPHTLSGPFSGDLEGSESLYGVLKIYERNVSSFWTYLFNYAHWSSWEPFCRDCGSELMVVSNAVTVFRILDYVGGYQPVLIWQAFGRTKPLANRTTFLWPRPSSSVLIVRVRTLSRGLRVDKLINVSHLLPTPVIDAIVAAGTAVDTRTRDHLCLFGTEAH